MTKLYAEQLCPASCHTDFFQRTFRILLCSNQEKHKEHFQWKKTHSGSAKRTTELKLKHELIEIKAKVRINYYIWVKSSFVRFNM